MVGDTGLELPAKSAQKRGFSGLSAPRGTESGTLGAESNLDDLARRLAALPESVRASLLAAVKATQPQERKV